MTDHKQIEGFFLRSLHLHCCPYICRCRNERCHSFFNLRSPIYSYQFSQNAWTTWVQGGIVGSPASRRSFSGWYGYQPRTRNASRFWVRVSQFWFCDDSPLLTNLSSLLKSLASVRASPVKDKLSKELEIFTNDMTAIPPTHMLAVFGKQLTGKSQPRRVTLYPVHSLVFASFCTSLPNFPSPPPVALPEEGIRKVDAPVWPLSLPSPATYPHLSTYLYSKRTPEEVVGWACQAKSIELILIWIPSRNRRRMELCRRLSRQRLDCSVVTVCAEGRWEFSVCCKKDFTEDKGADEGPEGKLNRSLSLVEWNKITIEINK
jgi:hypothetical protein